MLLTITTTHRPATDLGYLLRKNPARPQSNGERFPPASFVIVTIASSGRGRSFKLGQMVLPLASVTRRASCPSARKIWWWARRRRWDSPWQLAFIRGNLGIVRLLADRGADLTQIGRCGESLLHFAAEFGHEATICWLLDLGADANIRSDFGDTPLHRAAESDHVASAKALLTRGADASPQNHVQSQPLHSAYSLEMIQLLVESGGADVNEVNGGGDWPLMLAAEANDIERIAWLVNHGAELDRTSTGETALHTAVRFDSREAANALLKAGANPNLQDVDGWTPLFGAFSREVIHALRKAGADPRITDQVGEGPEKWLKDPILVRALREQL